eukprot:gene30220-35208_t
MWIQLQRLFWKPAETVKGASRRKLSQHPEADDADAWDVPTTKEEARPKTLEELCKLMSDSILLGVNQHHGTMQQVKGVRVGDTFIDERMTQALLIASALEMAKKKDGIMEKERLVDSQYQQVLIRALEAATELHTSLGHTLHVPLRDLVQGPTFAIQNNGRPIAEVEVSHNSNFSLKKSSEIGSCGDGIMPAKHLQAVSFLGQTTVAWEGLLKREELMGLTVPRTVTQVPFLQLPEQTLMQILEEGFSDSKISHRTPKSEVPRLMNITLPSEYQDNLLRTRNQLFKMLVRAVVASARSQRLVAEWQVKSWDETRVAVEHKFSLSGIQA